jgi:hypothetical protein
MSVGTAVAPHDIEVEGAVKATSIRYKTSPQDDWVARFAQKERQLDELRSRESARAMHQRDVQLHRLRNAIAILKDRVAHMSSRWIANFRIVQSASRTRRPVTGSSSDASTTRRCA